MAHLGEGTIEHLRTASVCLSFLFFFVTVNVKAIKNGCCTVQLADIIITAIGAVRDVLLLDERL